MDIEDFLSEDLDLARLERECSSSIEDALILAGIDDESPQLDALKSAALSIALVVSQRLLSQYHEWLAYQLPAQDPFQH